MIDDVLPITPGYESITQFDGQWYVVHTRSRFEKALAADLLRLGICYYLPMRLKSYVSSGKKRRSLLPLFTSYLFCCSPDKEAKTRLYQSGRVVSVIEVIDRNRFVKELAAIEAALADNHSLETYDSIPIGQRCRVISGALLGTEGVAIECKPGKARVVLEVTVLGKGVVMEIDRSMLETISI